MQSVRYRMKSANRKPFRTFSTWLQMEENSIKIAIDQKTLTNGWNIPSPMPIYLYSSAWLC